VAQESIFDRASERYDRWYDEHAAIYAEELRVLRELVPRRGPLLEIGVGTGRFAEPLGVTYGLDPSLPMLRRAAARGVTAICGRGEALPFASGSFAGVLLVTTLCFLDDPRLALGEARRVLREGGRLVVADLDRETAYVRALEARREESEFYRDAHFHSLREVEALIVESGFQVFARRRALAPFAVLAAT
jgi:SAM-dependent methyltransferase